MAQPCFQLPPEGGTFVRDGPADALRHTLPGHHAKSPSADCRDVPGGKTDGHSAGRDGTLGPAATGSRSPSSCPYASVASHTRTPVGIGIIGAPGHSKRDAARRRRRHNRPGHAPSSSISMTPWFLRRRAGSVVDNDSSASPPRRQDDLDRHQRRDTRLARELIGAWVTDYNTARPHSSLGCKTPAGYAGTLTATKGVTLVEAPNAAG
jgi:hypothetical protein